MIGKRAAYTLQPALQQTHAQLDRNLKASLTVCMHVLQRIPYSQAPLHLLRKMLGLHAFNASQFILQP